MADKVRWGVLGVSKFAVEKIIPAMQHCGHAEITAIASRRLDTARAAAERFGLARAYGSYDELLADPEIDVIYNPLPNHLHVPMSIRAAEAGKHVLCEKPVALNAAECATLIEARDRTGRQIAEAFMVAVHPQWIRAREIFRSGEIGAPRAIMTAFSYMNRDAANIRNVASYGGGGMMDIGCYAVFTSRYLLGEEPESVQAMMRRDAEFGVDLLASGLMRFASADALFTCGTQQEPYQRTQILGEDGRIEIEIPFNAPPEAPARISIHRGGHSKVEEMPVCNQYTLQGDLFSIAVRDGTPLAVTLENSLGNMKVIDALFRAAESGRAETP
jgi:predicted dehydrogenase